MTRFRVFTSATALMPTCQLALTFHRYVSDVSVSAYCISIELHSNGQLGQTGLNKASSRNTILTMMNCFSFNIWHVTYSFLSTTTTTTKKVSHVLICNSWRVGFPRWIKAIMDLDILLCAIWIVVVFLLSDMFTISSTCPLHSGAYHSSALLSCDPGVKFSTSYGQILVLIIPPSGFTLRCLSHLPTHSPLVPILVICFLEQRFSVNWLIIGAKAVTGINQCVVFYFD